MTSTTGTVADLMVRNSFGVFGERDGATRAAAIAEIYAADAVLHLGADVVHGTEAIDEHIRVLLEGTPGYVFQILGESEVDGALGTRAWGFGPEEAPPVVTGRDVVRVENGRIAEILVLVHPPTG